MIERHSFVKLKFVASLNVAGPNGKAKNNLDLSPLSNHVSCWLAFLFTSGRFDARCRYLLG